MGNRGLRYTFVLTVAAAAVAGFGCGSDHTPTATSREQAVTTCISLDAAADAMLSNPPMGHNFGGMPILRVGGKDESILRFDLGSVPANAAVERAALNLYVSSGDVSQVNAHRITVAWAEDTATYASFNQQFDKQLLGGFKTVTSNNQKSIDLSDLVRSWMSGGAPNYGVLLESASSKKTIFVSREGGTLEQKPHLEVCFTVPDDNHCEPDPCENGGTCENNNNSYTCQCPAGYDGDRCEHQIDNCASNPCQNGATCDSHVGGYVCTCAAGYTGSNCETLIDNCAPNPCQNGGVCDNGVNSYTCQCPPGFDGTNCEHQIDNCASNPCQNGGTCNNLVNAYSCSCEPGFTGDNCEVNVNDCAGDPCHNGGTCIDGVNSYSCTCAPDWTGATCDVNIDACEQRPCLNGGTCSDGIGLDLYSCECAAGFTGDNCEIDINDCAGNPCENGGACVDGVASYTCQCTPGYTGTNCETFGCATALDGTPCDDSNACTTADTCQAGTCVGASPVQCAAAPDQCHQDGVCDPATGACSNPLEADGTACSDSNACTDGDTCQAGACVSGALAQCEGTCDPGTGVCTPDGPPIVLTNIVVGQNLEATTGVTLGSPAPSAGLTVTVTSGDPQRVLLSTDPTAPGSSSVTVTFAPGATISDTALYVQALDGAGSVGLVATAPRCFPTASTATLVPAGIAFDSGDISTTTQSPNVTLTLAAAALDPQTFARIANQRVRGGFSVDAAIATASGLVGGFSQNPVHFAGGDITATTEFDPLEVGATTLTIEPPAGFATPASGTEISITITGPILNLGDPGLVGKGLESSFRVDLAALAGPNGVPLTITSADPTRLLVSASPTDTGTESVVVIVPPNAITSAPIYIQALASNAVIGVNVTSPGYTPQTRLITLVPSGFALTTGNFSTTTTSPNTNLTVQAFSLDPVLLTRLVAQPLRGGSTVDVNVTSSNTTVGRITTSPLHYSGGDVSQGTQFAPSAAGTTTITVQAPPGFSTPATGATAVASVSQLPDVQVKNLSLIGKDLQAQGAVTLAAPAPAGGVAVTVSSDDTSRLLVATTATGAGQPSVVVNIAQGNTTANVFVQALSDTGTPTVTASASGYRSIASGVALKPTGFVFNNASFTISQSAPNTTLTLLASPLDPATRVRLATSQAVRGGFTINVPVTSSNPAAGVITVSPVPFSGGAATTQFDPIAVGTTTLSADPPAGYVRPFTGSQITATVGL